ncbi:MAG: hypothetical protein JW820_00040 [Spirochaetales bacterium]|nr:hypothetical protein [Spirochaetales bacterium]
MSTRQTLTLFLGLRFHDAESQTLRTVESLLEEIASLEGELRLPLHWNVPLYPLFAGSSRALNNLVTEIKARVASRGDILAPAGFRGAMHPLLDDYELARELAWCRRNPWLSGFRQLLGQEPLLTIPFLPDPAREAAAGAYSSAGFQIIGVPFPLGGARDLPLSRRARPGTGVLAEGFVLSRLPGRAAAVAAAVLDLSELDQDSAVLASLAARAPETLLLLLDVQGADGAGTSRGEGALPGSSVPRSRRQAPAGPLPAGDRPIARLLEALSYRRALHPAALTPAALDELEMASGETAAAAPPLAVLLHRSEACRLLEAETAIAAGRRLQQLRPYRRRGRRRNEEVRRALELMVPDWAPALEVPPPARAARDYAPVQPDQIQFAEMGGTVSLPGSQFVAQFADGRLRGISREGREILSGAPAECSFAFAGVRCALRTVSAASFERGQDHGLATSLSATIGPRGGELKMQVEAYFREGLSDLCVECTIRFPAQAPALWTALPYEIPLFRFPRGAPPELSTVFEDGSTHRERVLPAEGYLLACGRQVLASQGETALVLTAGGSGSPPGAGPLMVVPLRVRREAGRWALRACPGARTCVPHPLPVAGWTTHLSFRIGIREI